MISFDWVKRTRILTRIFHSLILKTDHVRIPRNQMLMRYAKVSSDGKYEKPPHAKFNYTTMVMVRTGMVEGSFEVCLIVF